MFALLNLLAAEGAHTWHFWLGALMAPAAVLGVIAVFVLYFFKVTRTRYPRK